jgi:spermidine synthase
LLYTKEFYEIVQSRLSPNGIISVQSGSATYTELVNLCAVHNTLRSVFPSVCAYQIDMPSFGGPWGFCMASIDLNPLILPADEIDKRISSRGSEDRLKIYDGLTHQCMFSLPKHLRNELAKPGRLITDDNPLYTYSSNPA